MNGKVRKGPTARPILFLVGLIEDLGFRRIILKCDNEPSTKKHSSESASARTTRG